MALMSETEVEAEEKEEKTEKVAPEIEEMFRAGVHFGYSRSRRHPKMKPYIFGMRNNVEVLDLPRVSEKLAEAEDFLKKLASEKGTLLIVGSKPPAASLVEKAGQELSMPFSARRWPGGMLTNFGVVRKRLDHLEELKSKKASGELAKYTKKEQLVFDEEISGLEQKFAGLISLKKIPNAMLVVDPCEEKTVVREAKRLGLKSVGIVNVDCDPDNVTYPVPANDSAHSSIEYVLNRLVRAYKSGLAEAENTEAAEAVAAAVAGGGD
ncbi:MAG: 30S ribosomal protein S2 [Candidatus Niyogibacteria bacterium]|nr:30S ribosomal protein S2 [Candidatus Niyogibacteria bacterium]